MFLKKLISMSNQKTLKIAFVNPPHADWSLANNMTYLMCQSHYTHNGKYADRVQWLPAPYKWNKYQSYEEIYEEIKEADIIMFSSYAWNYTIVDSLCKYVKDRNANTITVIGGPHIGTNETMLMIERLRIYDFICQPTKPGESFIEDLINSYIEDGYPILDKISWAIGSTVSREHSINMEDYSVYEEHVDYLKDMVQYARSSNMEPFVILETTRGCPYGCVFCEWGGGINTKIIKKRVDIVERDILALKRAGFRDAYLTDANFGAFKERDIGIFKFAWSNGFNLTDISTVKIKDIDRRKSLVDAWFEIVGRDKDKHTKSEGGTDMWSDTAYISVVPTVSIQSVSDTAMKIAERVDLSTEDKLELSRYIKKRCEAENFPIPAIELILAMPGSTIDDFYTEMEIIWNFKAWGSFRHDYMFLPDSKLNSQEYKEKYKIETVEVYSDVVDEDGIDNWNSLYKNKKTYFRTIRQCFSFTEAEMVEMWIMNNAANYLLKNFYPLLEDIVKPKEFAKQCYLTMRELEDFKVIEKHVQDIFNPNTPARSIRQINGRFRVEVIESLLEKNSLLIRNGVTSKCLLNTN